MDKTVELEVLNIVNSRAQAGAFAMLLGEVGGDRKMPVIIGPAEAQAVAVFLKKIDPPRPLTHDLFATVINTLGAKLLRVLIYKAKEGVFYSYIYMERDSEVIRIDSRTSDAVGLALRAHCPILVYDTILEQERVHLSEEESMFAIDDDDDDDDEKDFIYGDAESETGARVKSLEKALEQAIEDEDYELAAEIRDQISTLKRKSK
ncbi:MAG: DUF151 domain-containing protein [Mediterranea sp.]|jgi:bifunctional DNase/RNase|nr:DUF151 domain-containing protein [Mediterranea sp.]